MLAASNTPTNSSMRAFSTSSSRVASLMYSTPSTTIAENSSSMSNPHSIEYITGYRQCGWRRVSCSVRTTLLRDPNSSSLLEKRTFISCSSSPSFVLNSLKFLAWNSVWDHYGTFVVLRLRLQLVVDVVLQLLQFEVAFVPFVRHLLLNLEHFVGHLAQDKGLAFHPRVLLGFHQLEQFWVMAEVLLSSLSLISLAFSSNCLIRSAFYSLSLPVSVFSSLLTLPKFP